MKTIKKVLATVRNHLPAYLRNEKTPEQRKKQVIASTSHG